ncbi:MAG: D-alanine--D-alanine ligase [Rikenellaceae bacterium]
MKRLKIALLAGGNSSEREIALQSASQIESALDKEKYNITIIDIHHREWCYTSPTGERFAMDKNDFSLSIGEERRNFDYALIIIHGTPGEDGMLQGYLEMMGIPFSSCSMTSSVITFDKLSTKRAVASCGVNLAKEIFLRRGEPINTAVIVEKLGLPIFVKPNASGSSFGVSRVTREEEIKLAIETALTESDEVLIEEAIVGREMGCGVMVTSQKEYLLPITEILPKADFFSTEAKYTAGLSNEITPAQITDEIKSKLNEATLAVYKACRCRGVVRVDFIVTEAGEPYMIEVNSIPGMSSGSLIPQQIRAAGMTIGEFFDIAIEDTYKSQCAL